MLLTRVITALVMVSVFGLALFVADDYQWLIFMLVGTLWAAWEWGGFAKLKAGVNLLYSSGVTVIAYLLYVYFEDTPLFFLAPLVVLVMWASVTLFQIRQGKALLTSSVIILGLGGLIISAFFISMIVFRQLFSAELLLLCLSVIWAVDIGAYFSGKRFGKHKLAVYVSPGKTWEGVLGGIVFAFVTAYVGLSLLHPYTLTLGWQTALILSLIGLFSVYGDLFESLLKRQADIKDSGHLLPGHGGLLDRIDSLLFAMPVFYIFWLWIS